MLTSQAGMILEALVKGQNPLVTSHRAESKFFSKWLFLMNGASSKIQKQRLIFVRKKIILFNISPLEETSTPFSATEDAYTDRQLLKFCDSIASSDASLTSASLPKNLVQFCPTTVCVTSFKHYDHVIAENHNFLAKQFSVQEQQ